MLTDACLRILLSVMLLPILIKQTHENKRNVSEDQWKIILPLLWCLNEQGDRECL